MTARHPAYSYEFILQDGNDVVVVDDANGRVKGGRLLKLPANELINVKVFFKALLNSYLSSLPASLNQSIKREIARLEYLGERVEVTDNKIIIHNRIVPKFIAEILVERIKKADTDNKYEITIKPA